MNAFRLVFLLVVLLASALLSFSREAPAVFSSAQRQALERTVESAARAASAAEVGARVERELAARRIVDDPMVYRLLASTDEESPLMRTNDGASIFSAAMQRVSRESDVDWTLGALFGAQGDIYTTAGLTEQSLTPMEFARIAGVQESTTRNRSVHRYFEHNGELWASVALPITETDGRRGGRLVLAERWGTRGANMLRRATGAHVGVFHGTTLAGETFGDDETLEIATGIARRTTAFNAGTGDQLGLVEYRTFPDPNAIAGDEERVGAFAPIAFRGATGGDQLTGAILLVDAPRPGNSLFQILVQGRAWDDGTADLWFSIASGLLLFFLGLFLHDYSMQRASRRIESDVEAVVTTNDPPPLVPGHYSPFFRPIARAFNLYLESTRQQAAALRRLRDDLAMTRDELDEAMHLIQSRGITGTTDPGSRAAHASPPAETIFRGPPPPSSGSPPQSAPESVSDLGGALDFLEAAHAAVATPAAAPPPPSPPARPPAPLEAFDDLPDFDSLDFDEDPLPFLSSPASSSTRPPTPDRPAEVTREIPSVPPESRPVGRSESVLARLELARAETQVEPKRSPFAAGTVEPDPAILPTRHAPEPPAVDGDVTAVPGLTTNRHTLSMQLPDLAAHALHSDAPLQEGHDEPEVASDNERGTVPRADLDELVRAGLSSAAPASSGASDDVLKRAEQKMRDLGMSSFGSSGDIEADIDPEVRQLYDDYMRLRAQTPEAEDDLPIEVFLRRLDRNRSALMRRHGCVDVRFRVDLANGKAALKATPIY